MTNEVLGDGRAVHHGCPWDMALSNNPRCEKHCKEFEPFIENEMLFHEYCD